MKAKYLREHDGICQHGFGMLLKSNGKECKYGMIEEQESQRDTNNHDIPPNAEQNCAERGCGVVQSEYQTSEGTRRGCESYQQKKDPSQNGSEPNFESRMSGRPSLAVSRTAAIEQNTLMHDVVDIKKGRELRCERTASTQEWRIELTRKVHIGKMGEGDDAEIEDDEDKEQECDKAGIVERARSEEE